MEKLAPNALNVTLSEVALNNLKAFQCSNKLQKAVVTFIASSLKDDEVASLKHMFQAMDKNGTEGRVLMRVNGHGQE